MTGSLTERYDDRIAGVLSCYGARTSDEFAPFPDSWPTLIER
jgi:hypothetical protein